MTHYDALGASPTATPTELREAFRRSARAAHPDRHGEASSARMAAVNEAWRVLGDPDRRRRYDAELASADRTTAGSASPRSSPRDAPAPEHRSTVVAPYRPSRFPWRFMAAMASVGVAFILFGVIVYDPPPPRTPDGILRGGDCVDLTTGLEAVEVSCGTHDAVVDRLIPFDQTCPADTEPYRDRQGMGTACVVRPIT